MMLTKVDIRVLEEIASSYDSTNLYSSSNKELQEFIYFLQGSTDLLIYGDFENCNELTKQLIIFLQNNRGKTNLKPVKNKFNNQKEQKIQENFKHAFYLIEEDDINLQKRYLSLNGEFIGFHDSFMETWKKLCLFNFNGDVIKVGGVDSNFKNWSDTLSKIPNFKDIVIADPFLFEGDESSVNNNIIKILKTFSELSNIKFKISIFSSIKLSKKEREAAFNLIKKNRKKLRLNFDFELIFIEKFHDRIIATNYFMLKSGNSFNFLDSNGQLFNDIEENCTIIDMYTLSKIKDQKVYNYYLSNLRKKRNNILIDGNNSHKIYSNKVNLNNGLLN